MIDQKWVDFDYQRYLHGDAVFYRNGDKFEGEVLIAKKFIDSLFPLIVIHKDGEISTVDKKGFYSKDRTDHRFDLVMKQKVIKSKLKTKKLWMAYQQFTPTEFETTNLFEKQEELMKHYSDSFLSKAKFIQIEVDV